MVSYDPGRQLEYIYTVGSKTKTTSESFGPYVRNRSWKSNQTLNAIKQ
jgi:hypothetical protein